MILSEKGQAFAKMSMTNYGRELARRFSVSSAPSMLVDLTTRTSLGVTRVTRTHGLTEPSGSITPERGFTIPIHLIAGSRNWGTWIDGRFVKADQWHAGGIAIFDLESDPRAWRDTPFDCVHYNLPRATLDAFADNAGLPRVTDLVCEQGIEDATLYHMTRIVLPHLGSTRPPSALFMDHFALMLCTYLMETYATTDRVAVVQTGGLARWQMQRVRELIDANPGSDLRLGTLAQECGLSMSQFARSFKRSFGHSVHRYVILQRVESAKCLLQSSRLRLTDIAQQAGFSDQAAFSRTFHAVVGTTPSQWRAENGCNPYSTSPST
jgi:AraC family transcriptional regulator